MRLLDQTRAILRLVLHNSEAGTVSEEAMRAASAAHIEREKTNRAMDDLLSSLVRRRVERQVELSLSSESSNGTIHK